MNYSSNKAEHFVNTSYGNIALFRGSFSSQKFKPHFHESYTIIFVDKGIGDYSTSKSNYIVSKNTILVLNPYEVHTGKSVDNQPWSFLTLYIPVDVMKKAVKNQSDNTLAPFFKEKKIKDQDLFLLGLEVFPSLVGKGNMEISDSVLTNFLKDLLSKYSYDSVEEKSLSQRFMIAKSIRAYIHETYDEEISLETLSKDHSISKYNLIKIFKEYYDLPPHQYLLNLKIEKAKKLLLQNHSCTEVAYLSGFFDQSHFSRHFKRIVGITPKKYTTVII